MKWLLMYGLVLSTALLAADSDKQGLYAKTDVNNQERVLPFTQVLVRNGYAAETHTILTEDGYLLGLHHIPQKQPDASKVVIVFRCLFCNSYVYLLLGPQKALGYLLVDAGYDVWFAEMRGNSYSNSHVYLKKQQSKFWNFSWHEMGVYDVPAVLDYVTSRTSADKVYSVGFSMGTTAMFVAGAMRPEYMSKIRLFIGLAPVAFRSHTTGVAASLARLLTPNVMNLIPNGAMFPKQVIALYRYLSGKICSTYLSATVICESVFTLVGGKNFINLNTTLFPVITAHTPDQESLKTFFHYSQGVRSGKFRQYDYGRTRNLQVYGNNTPPEYNLTQITAPVALIWSKGDSLADTEDVKILISKLPNVVYQKEINDPNFSHFDFVFGNQAPTLVNTEVVNILQNSTEYT